MTRLLTVFLLAGLAVSGRVEGQAMVMKDGRRIVAKTLRRQGDSIMAANPSENGAKAMDGEIGYPLAQVEKLEFPEPAPLKSAPELIVRGRAAEAIALLEPAIRYYEGFRDAPGSYWGDLALLKGNALLSLGREAEVEPLAAQIIRLASDPETIMGARTQAAACLTRKGQHPRAVELLEQVLRDATRPETLASASIYKGQGHIALMQWEPGLLSFLALPVFFPEQKSLAPASMLGAGRAYFGLEDFDRAKETLNEVITTYGATPEAEAAKTELEKIARKEKALEGPK